VSPTDVDAVFPASFKCWHYSLVQTGDLRWDFHYVADETTPHAGLEAAVGLLLGQGVRVNAFRRKTIPPAPSGKFALLKPLAR
jgi:phenylacetate-CoA ligase